MAIQIKKVREMWRRSRDEASAKREGNTMADAVLLALNGYKTAGEQQQFLATVHKRCWEAAMTLELHIEQNS